jgi:hypothetical protein
VSRDIQPDFDTMLRHLRGLAAPCAPPVGVGSFLVLYASAREVVVWYSPVRDGHREGEVAIPCARLVAAWDALLAGQTLDEAALEALCASLAGARWLLAILAQLPGVVVRAEPLAVTWRPAVLRSSEEPVTVDTAPCPARRARRARRVRATAPRRAS